MTRAELVGEVIGLLSQALTDIGIPATDTAGALREPVNRTLRALGAAQAGLTTAVVADGDEEKAIAFGRYFVLDRLVDAAHGFIDLGGSVSSLKQQQTVQSLERQRDRALIVAVAHGLAGYTAKTSANVAPIPIAGGIARTAYFANEPSGAETVQW